MRSKTKATLNQTKATLTLAALAALGPLTPALAQTQAVQFKADGYFSGELSTVGWRFTTNRPVTVSALEFFDENGDGFYSTHTVGIFDSQGRLLTSTRLDAGRLDPFVAMSSPERDDGFRYRTISPITLPAGQQFTIAGNPFEGGGAGHPRDRIRQLHAPQHRRGSGDHGGHPRRGRFPLGQPLPELSLAIEPSQH